ncbi:MAG: FadR/GntR family transcriptional regulator [Thermomicrobiales bacterium]
MSAPFPQVEPIRRETASAEIARRLVDHLLSGNVTPGSRLPSERQLAEAFGVGRSAVREALAALSLIGLIEVRHGDGTFLKRVDSPLLPQVVEWGLLLGEQHTADLIEARQRLEVVVAGLAAERRSEADLAALELCLARMAEQAHSNGDVAAFVDADVDFHLRLADAAGNSALRDVLASIQSLLRAWIGRVIAAGTQQASYEEHVPIMAAVREGNATAAAAAMDAHMRSAANRLEGTLERAARDAVLTEERETTT